MSVNDIVLFMMLSPLLLFANGIVICCLTDFSEALAGLTLRLIEAGELDKEKVKRILE